MIYTNTIGSDNHIHTNVAISSPLLNKALAGDKDTQGEQEIQDLQTSLQTVKQAITDLQNQIQVFVSKPDKTEKERTLIKLLLGKKAKNVSELSSLDRTIKEKQQAMQENKKSTADFKVVALSKIFPGVKLKIGPFTQTLDAEYDNTKIYTDAENIIFVPVSPADKMDSF